MKRTKPLQRNLHACARSKRTEEERNRDFVDIARLYLEGHTMRYIAAWISEDRYADRNGLTHQTIHKDLQEIHRQWKDSMLTDHDEKVAKELARLDKVEAEYWAIYYKSCKAKDQGSVETVHGPDGNAVQTKKIGRTEKRDGSVAALAGITKCIEQRCKLLGLNEPDKLSVRDDGLISWQDAIEKANAGYERSGPIPQDVLNAGRKDKGKKKPKQKAKRS